MERFELVNDYTIDCNEGVREVEGRERLLALAQEAGWLNVRRLRLNPEKQLEEIADILSCIVDQKRNRKYIMGDTNWTLTSSLKNLLWSYRTKNSGICC